MSEEHVTVLVEVPIPLSRIADAVGFMVHQRLVDKSAPRLKVRPTNDAVKASIERVVAAIDHLERVTHTVGEPGARDALMAAVRGLRKAHLLNRKS
ncbi:hypothetical protein SAMN05880590_102770 [Rhizobium sp. RU35A]|uniref:hypothetical protein n=1 Tax=Rhizobium sp. RU35A TaxID=1907414 RepID=UPI000957371A|nr:hypothetical protein [Rhizobium sp. RU35A]SIQ24507.1 hypothetical protein SAMN05880590_102770 [Rhizobium sp. RU35A]